MRPQVTALATAALSAVLLFAAPSRAEPRDDEAKKLQHDASVDYLGAKFNDAAEKLEKALKLCRKGKCSKDVRAELYRDLGVVQFTGLDNADKGKEALGQAVALKSDIELDKDITTPALAKAFDELKKNPPAVKADPDDEPKPEETPKPPEEEKKPGEQRKNWFSLTVQQDFALIYENTDDVCTYDNQVHGPYSCFRLVSTQYRGTPINGRNDFINTGIDVGTTRILVGYDRVLVGGLTAGVRFGVAIRGGGPKPEFGDAFLPIHAEARVGYWFGDDAFVTAGFHPFVFVAGGAAQVDTKYGVDVVEDPNAMSAQMNPREQVLDAYRHMGKGFVSAGVGAMYAITPMAGILFDVRAMQFFPVPGTVISPELGFAIGL